MFQTRCVKIFGGLVADKKPAAFCLFLLILFLGAIFALTVCLMIILLGCAFPGPMQTSGTYNLKCPRLYNLNHCLTSDFHEKDSSLKAQTPPLNAQKFNFKESMLKKSPSNVYNLWIFFLVVYLVTSQPAPFLPA